VIFAETEWIFKGVFQIILLALSVEASLSDVKQPWAIESANELTGLPIRSC